MNELKWFLVYGKIKIKLNKKKKSNKNLIISKIKFLFK